MLSVDLRKRVGDFHLRAAFAAETDAVVLFGPSGAGKSLTLQCLAGLAAPDAGSIRVGGRTLFDAASGVNVPARLRRVGYVFQSYALFPHLTVAQNVAFGLRGVPRAERAERVAEVVRLVRLEGLEQRKPTQLSGGQQQRAALARALAPRPEMLLLDEPLAAVDALLREELRRELLALLEELRVRSVIVTHDLPEACALGKEIALYEAGRVLQFGPRDEVFHRPSSRRAAELLGARNLLRGRVEEAAGGSVRVAGPGFALRARIPPAERRLAPGEQVDCCVRPEAVEIAARCAPGDPGEPGCLRAVLLDEMPAGSRVRLRFRLLGGDAPEIHAEAPEPLYRRLRESAEALWLLSIRPEDVHLLPAGRDD